MIAEMTRPVMPPTALPLIYNPMAEAIADESISSARYAMATEGTPARTMPCMKRIPSREGKVALNDV
jgi:hypothetical protein